MEILGLSIKTIILIIAGVYDVLARLIPTVGNWSWSGRILELLKWLSDFLNIRKK